MYEGEGLAIFAPSASIVLMDYLSSAL